MNWTQKLLQWYFENKRAFLWRETQEPYKVWLSEIILQQTRTAQGLPYFKRFIETFPTLETLALASEDQVLKLWQGLGYYSRARNLHFTAQYIHTHLKGQFPKTFHDLMALKGVGDYTASAIASICYGLPEPVVDGNVYRFLSRFFGISTPINTPIAHRTFKAKAKLLMGQAAPGIFNQAMMEFGALQCIPQNPKCADCPFILDCNAYNQDKIDFFPVKHQKQKVRTRFFNYLVVSDPDQNYLMEKRTQKGIWQNLYQFPLIETKGQIKSSEKLKVRSEFPTELANLPIALWNKAPITHKLTHQILEVNFWLIQAKTKPRKAYSKDAIKALAVPVVVQNFIEEFF